MARTPSLSWQASKNAVSVVQAGFGGAQPKPGVEEGPQKILDGGLAQTMLRVGRQIDLQPLDDFNLYALKPLTDPHHRGMNDPRWVSAATCSISEQVYAQSRTGNQVLTLGGDHSIAMGTLTGSARAIRERLGRDQKLGVIYVDAHADLNVPEQSESGNIHGMSVAFASGLATSSEPEIFDWIRGDHLIDLSKFVYIGLRDLDETEKTTVRDKKIKAFWVNDVRHFGIEQVIQMSLDHLQDMPIHVSFDIDGLDPKWAPSTGLPVVGGLTLDEGVLIMDKVNQTGRLIAMDVVEVNPRIGDAVACSRTIESALAVIKAGFQS